MFKKGLKQAKRILVDNYGVVQAGNVLRGVKFCYTSELPFWVNNIPETGWMGFCCLDNGFYIYINSDQHKHADEISLTLGHEFAHVIQEKVKGSMNHSDGIFKGMRNMYCSALGYKKKSF